ncbi:MAG: sugar ABC transporter permease [Hydrogenophaga sp.]
MTDQILQTVLAVVVSVGLCLVYFYGTNFVLDRILALPFATRNRREGIRAVVQPWLFVLPALALLGVYLVYPLFETARLSFHNATGEEFVGLANYKWVLIDPNFLITIRNNFMWLLVVPAMATLMGLIVAVLADRVWWGNIAKTMIFMPMAISFVGASVIWKFVFDFRGPDAEQIGILNAMVMGMGLEPQAWVTLPFWNNFFLMAILIWIQTGFAMVILSAALRGVPTDTIEAARIDGANELQIFVEIMVPQVLSTILVVWTTITITVLKVFDIVMAMTGGQWDTSVLANLMYDWMFRGGGDYGRSSTLAMVLMLAVIPVMAFNIRRFRAEEAQR